MTPHRERPAGNRASRESIEGDASSIPLDHAALDYAHAGHMAGRSEGFAQGQRAADEDRAHEIVHAYACRMAGIAVRTAREHFGDGWASEIAQQASGVDW